MSSQPPHIFALGDAVEWTSRGGSGEATKRGRVVALVPAGTDIDAFKTDLAGSHDLSPVMLCGQHRTADSYLVEVIVASGRKPKLYWPRTEHLVHCIATAIPPRTQLMASSRQMGLFQGGNVRRLLGTGRVVVESDEMVSVTLATRCPQKWAYVDLETGTVWENHDGRRFKRAPAEMVDAVIAAVKQPRDMVRGLHARRRPARQAQQPD